MLDDMVACDTQVNRLKQTGVEKVNIFQQGLYVCVPVYLNLTAKQLNRLCGIW